MIGLLATRIIATILFLGIYIKIEVGTYAFSNRTRQLKAIIKCLILNSVLLNLGYAVLDYLQITGLNSNSFIIGRVTISVTYSVANLILLILLFNRITEGEDEN